jgi:nitroreductase
LEFSEVIRRRHMVRNYDGSPVADADLDRVLAAGRRAPSAGNTQGTEFLVLRGPAETECYWSVTLPEPRRSSFAWPGLLRAPVLIIPCAHPDAYVTRYGEADKAATGLGTDREAWPVPYWHIDAGMAAMAMLLAAVDAGLGALFFGIFTAEDALRSTLAIPDGFAPIGTIAVGYPAVGYPALDRPAVDRPAVDRPGRSVSRGHRSAEAVIHRGRW